MLFTAREAFDFAPFDKLRALDGLNLHPAAIALQRQTEEAIILLSPYAYYIVSRVGGESAARELTKKEQK